MSLLKNILNLFIEKNINSEKNNIKSLNDILDSYKKDKTLLVESTINGKTIDIDSNITYQNDEGDDENREFKDFCTDIVTNHILDEHELYNLLYIINSFYTDCINLYITKKKLNPDDIIFIFKGGNIFKLIAHKFWSELPNKAMYKFIEEYKNYFKRSDLDFGIYINPDLGLEVSDDITLISYKIQLVITELLIKHKEICFKWFKYDQKNCQIILKKLLQDINKANVLNNSKSIYYNNKITNIQFINSSAINTRNKYENQSNYQFKFENDNLKNVNKTIEGDFTKYFNNKVVKQEIKSTISKKLIPSNFMYNNINKAIFITTTNSKILKFYLTRIKITFNLHLKNKINNKNVISIGGELIDVSIGSDKASSNFFNKRDKYIDSIELVSNTGFYKNTIPSFNINIYSFDYLYEDLKFILIDTLYLPWEDIKYKKRFFRLFYLTFIDLFNNTKTLPIKNKNINIISQYFKLLLNHVIDFSKKKHTDKDIDKISRLLKNDKQDKILSYMKCRKGCLLNNLLKYIISIIEKVLFPRKLINIKIHDNTFTNNTSNNSRKLLNDEFDHLIDLLKYVDKNLNTLKIVNEYICNYSKKRIEFNYKTIQSTELI